MCNEVRNESEIFNSALQERIKELLRRYASSWDSDIVKPGMGKTIHNDREGS